VRGILTYLNVGYWLSSCEISLTNRWWLSYIVWDISYMEHGEYCTWENRSKNDQS